MAQGLLTYLRDAIYCGSVALALAAAATLDAAPPYVYERGHPSLGEWLLPATPSMPAADAATGARGAAAQATGKAAG